MPSSNLLLLKHLEGGRIAHTYLLSGPEGEEKTRLALGFAKALNCEREKAFEECDCLSCRKIEKGIHPDVRRFGGEEEERSIKIEEVRNILHEASLRPFEGRWKVFILPGAERLTLEASNAILKTLEEPPEHSVFLLLVENKSHLLDTIRSRAFEVRLPPPPEKVPKENQGIRLLDEKGWKAFVEGLQRASRLELQELLSALLVYLRDHSFLEWKESRERSRQYLEAIDFVYETLEALKANANQKLALTHLEIQLEKILNV